ncbi:lethal(2) giant larvae protein-like isoform X2 [Artemia franciscana]|uniref:lethal(2) giant larvae protein-like isoform X2 n=1 Tax=Artemia franciscana TaxID=6661 RepID=UPI0032DA9C6C
MLKFIRAKGSQPSAERVKIQKELFQCQQTLQHGFPNKPVALAWDPILRLMAIATKSGVVKIFGKPGVEFYGNHSSSDVTILKLLFLPGQGRLLSVCDDNAIHLWEVNGHNLEQVQTYELEKNVKKISACAINTAGTVLYFGTEAGNVYQLDLHSFKLEDKVIRLDTVLQRIKEIYQKNPGAVECLLMVPDDPAKLIIGYNKGLLVQWNNTRESTERVWSVNQQLESVAWKKPGEELVSAHNDGSYVNWSVKKKEESLESKITTPYGPFPCKGITKIYIAEGEEKEWIVFSGGMPRAEYGDHNTVSVIHGDSTHVCFDLTSKVIDFFTVASENRKDLSALIILAEEELVAIDLSSEGWPVFKVPYLASLHSSAVTDQVVATVSNDLHAKLVEVGDKQLSSSKISSKPWPIDGGETGEVDQLENHLVLVTGHEDGSVQFWDITTTALKHILKYSTSPLFTGDDFEVGGEANDDNEEEWPPFRKVGVFDPYSDDPRLAVKKIVFCQRTGLVAIGGTAGQVVIINLEEEDRNEAVKVMTLDIVSDRDNFVWKGHSKLDTRTEPIKQPFGYKASSVVQLHPPAAITCLALHSSWGLIAVGTAHGLGLVDVVQLKGVVAKCTLTANDIVGGDHPMSRRKSFKKSLRESFRRLRKGRSQMNTERKGIADKGTGSQTPVTPTPAETRPVERQIEARNNDDSMAGMIRCLHLATTYIVSADNPSPTLWAGTNSGAVYIFTLDIPKEDKRNQSSVVATLAKEIQLRHRAPVISLSVVDGSYGAVREKGDTGASAPTEVSIPHRLVICSEEQIKIFTLPSLRPFGKFKLTATEGARIRRTAILRFTSSDGKHSENCLVCLTNLGEISILSLPDLKRQMNVNCIRREDIYGISSLVFARNGEAFYMHSSSEIQRIAFVAKDYVRLRCRLDLPEGLREIPKTPEKKEVAAAIEEVKVEPSPIKAETPAPESPTERLTNGVLEETKSSIPEGDFSIGDITIDSIRDHLTANLDETKSSLESRLEKMSFNISSTSSQRVVETVQVIKTKTNSTGETVSSEMVTMETNENSGK